VRGARGTSSPWTLSWFDDRIDVYLGHALEQRRTAHPRRIARLHSRGDVM
jgi:hypothetical protein